MSIYYEPRPNNLASQIDNFFESVTKNIYPYPDQIRTHPQRHHVLPGVEIVSLLDKRSQPYRKTQLVRPNHDSLSVQGALSNFHELDDPQVSYVISTSFVIEKLVEYYPDSLHLGRSHVDIMSSGLAVAHYEPKKKLRLEAEAAGPSQPEQEDLTLAQARAVLAEILFLDAIKTPIDRDHIDQSGNRWISN